MTNPNFNDEGQIWMNRFQRNGRQIFSNTLLAGLAIFIMSYGGLYIGLHLFPNFFIDYINPVFNSDGSRDQYFYLHPFVLALSLAVFWNRFRKMFGGNRFKIGLEFGIVYSFVALVPLLWITYSAMDIDFSMVATWLIYGLFQATIAGVVFAFIEKK